MKNLFKLLLISFMTLGLAACGETCEHTNTTTTYTEGDWLDVVKTVTCDECGEEVEETSLTSVEYIYNKEIINEKGIKVTIDKLKVDGWDMMELMITVEGNTDNKRTFETTNIFVNGVDSNAWIYASDLSGNRKANESHYIYDEIKVSDFFKSQDYKVEMDYSITNPETYDTLKEGSVSFNLNEYTSINEVVE